MAEDLGEKSEDATPRKLQEARLEGNIAKSTDASAALVLLAATFGLFVGLTPLLGSFAEMLRSALDPAINVDASNIATLDEAVRPAILTGLRVAVPALVISVVVVWLANVWQVGFIITTKALAIKPERLSPLSGFKRVFGERGVAKTGFDVLKLVLVGSVAYVTVASFARQIVGLAAFEPQLAAIAAGWMLFELAIKIAAVLLILGLADFAFQKWKHLREMRMTKQQIKDEYKQSEGDPEVKRRRHQIQRQIAMQRIQSSVPQADVIVTNPEHLSIAIQYDADLMHAPRVVAKGADHLALRIRQIAKVHSIPIIERRPLARALYKQVQVGQEIPPDHYKAVAEVLAFIYRLDGAAERRAARTKEKERVRAARQAPMRVAG
ncbi:MAG: flagellar biosynthesis protein FlhB [Phycisphaerae bacterium]|nr:flagellar biosynthesis protein FlhB [Phycisphaerae bacterium]